MPSDHCDLLCLDLPRAEALRLARRDEIELQAASAPARALADPTRLGLAGALAETDELCVCDLSWISERPQNLVSHHLRALRSAGLAESRRDGKMVLYSLTDAGRDLVSAVLRPRATEAVR